MAASSLTRRNIQVAVAVVASLATGAYAGWLQNTRLVSQITREKLFEANSYPVCVQYVVVQLRDLSYLAHGCYLP